jgi:hypothetical protein
MYLNFAVDKAIVHGLLTMDAKVQSHGMLCVICGGQSGIETAFFQVLRFSTVSVTLPVFHNPLSIYQ